MQVLLMLLLRPLDSQPEPKMQSGGGMHQADSYSWRALHHVRIDTDNMPCLHNACTQNAIQSPHVSLHQPNDPAPTFQTCPSSALA